MAADVRATFQIETLAQCLDESFGLLRMHWDEVCAHKCAMSVDPDIDAYCAAERAGKLLLVTARHGLHLIGYESFFVQRHLHYRTIFLATQDLSFLHPGFRRGRTGVRLIMFSEEMAVAKARALGAEPGKTLVTARVKFAHDHSVIYRRLGYMQQDMVLTKMI